MPEPAWYPDPDGTPGRLRYWDGKAWTSQTRPGVRPVVGPGRRGGRWCLVAVAVLAVVGPGRRDGRWCLVAVAVLAVVGLVVGAVWWLPRNLDADPFPTSSVSGGDDRSPSPTPTPSLSPSPSQSPTPAAQQPCAVGIPPSLAAPPPDSRVHGGPLSFTALGEPWSRQQPTNRFPYSRDGQVQTQRVPEQLPWQASAEVGVLEFDDYEDGPQATARLLDCLVDSDFYTSVNVRVTKRTGQEVKIGQTGASRLDARLEFTHPDLKTTGSDIRILVVQTQPRTYYFHAVPKERTDLIAELDAATASLRVD